MGWNGLLCRLLVTHQHHHLLVRLIIWTVIGFEKSCSTKKNFNLFEIVKIMCLNIENPLFSSNQQQSHLKRVPYQSFPFEFHARVTRLSAISRINDRGSIPNINDQLIKVKNCHPLLVTPAPRYYILLCVERSRGVHHSFEVAPPPSTG